MIIKKEKKGNILILIVDKDYATPDIKMNKKIKRDDIDLIIRENADVYTKTGELLLRFRKNKLSKPHVDAFYENVIDFANIVTSNRGSASGSKIKNVATNPKIKTNIIGYFDKLSPIQKYNLKKQGIPLPKITVRPTRFLEDFPEQYKKLIPLVKEIDANYKKYIPESYAKQKKKANQTPFHITGTAFTTITTNVNYQTTVHTDRGDDSEGFGNLAVIEHGKYKGGETCFPQYGIGVDVRTGDVLYMNVHEPHGNLEMEPETNDTVRLSIVCYLRKNVWEQTKGKTKKFMENHMKVMRKTRINRK